MAYPSTISGIAASFQAASLRAELGKLAEAEKGFQDVIARDGNGLYGRMARLGIAALQVRTSRFDPAIQTFSELSQRTDSDLPVDGILMQLAEAYRLAGRVPDALRAYAAHQRRVPRVTVRHRCQGRIRPSEGRRPSQLTPPHRPALLPPGQPAD